MVRKLPANSGDTGLIPGSEKSPRGGNGNSRQYSCLEKSHGQKSLADYSRECHKELDVTEHAYTHTFSVLSSITILILPFYLEKS